MLMEQANVKILMICLGNICRSPLAEGILQHKINLHKISAQVDSAGTAAYHIGKAPDMRSVAIARKNGIDISKQICRVFSVKDFEKFNHIYVMDQSNYADILSLAQNKEQKNKVRLILDGLDTEEMREVPDPYYDKDEGFTKVYTLLERACDQIVKSLL